MYVRFGKVEIKNAEKVSFKVGRGSLKVGSDFFEVGNDFFEVGSDFFKVGSYVFLGCGAQKILV